MFFVGILVFFAAVFVWTAVKFVRLKSLFLQKVVTKILINGKSFSSLAVKDFVDYILDMPKKSRVEIFKILNEKKAAFLIKIIDNKKHKKRLKMMIDGHVSFEANDVRGQLIAADLYIKNNMHDKALILLQEMKKIKNNSAEGACKKMCEAKIGMFEGDMAKASEDMGRALKIFQKKNMLYEEAEAYFVLGTMYRISGVFDVAEFMFRSAIKLFLVLGASNCLTEVFASMALMLSLQSRFEEAEEYLKKATKTAKNDAKLQGFVECQKAMLCLNQEKAKEAESIVVKIVERTKEKSVAMFAQEILCRIWSEEKKYSRVIKNIGKVFDYYWQEGNYGVALECLYLKAVALSKDNKKDEAETVLREVIDKEKLHKSSFFVANAYTLLGLLLLEKNETERAKTFFYLALEQELCCDRKKGVAIDYANLAMIEKKCGNRTEALKNLEAALKYAKEADDDLYEEIKKALD